MPPVQDHDHEIAWSFHVVQQFDYPVAGKIPGLERRAAGFARDVRLYERNRIPGLKVNNQVRFGLLP
jgi:hypothetical protein